MRTIIALLSLVAILASCDKILPKPRARSTPVGGGVRWKGVIMTGDDSIPAFDAARKKIKDIWIDRGIDPKYIRELSMAKNLQNARVKPSSAESLNRALRSLEIKKGEGCLLHLTSHGAPWGLYMRDQDPLSPAELDAMLDKHCGKAPTVIMVSACYSGVFTQKVLQRPNRVLLSAARDDRNSFGCGVEDKYTYWDACMIAALPSARSWAGLTGEIQRCIRKKERATKLRFSYPQAWIGRLADPEPVFGLPAQGDGA